MSVLSVRCGEGGLTSARMGEGGLVVVCFFGFNGMLLAPVCVGWELNPQKGSVLCFFDGPAVGFLWRLANLDGQRAYCAATSAVSSGVALGWFHVQRSAVR